MIIMKNVVCKILLVHVLMAGIYVCCHAGDLPALSADPQIKAGVLDNGIAYYLVTNTSEKGRADIALVQRGGYSAESENTAGSANVNAMGSLSSLPHFRTCTPFSYLSGNGIWPGKDGYVGIYQDAVVYSFRNLEFARSGEMVDSTLLLIFDVIGTLAEADGERYSPSNQAIVISGDIDRSAVLSKMNLLSLLVPKGDSCRQEEKEGAGRETRIPAFEMNPPVAKGLAELTVNYFAPRTAAENMNTVLPLVSQKFASELGIILKKRLGQALRTAGIPVANMSYSYLGSGSGPGDEKYAISVAVADRDIEKAASSIASVLASLDLHGAGKEEYQNAQNELTMDMKREYSGAMKPNRRYVDLCISSYLYGASLASSSDRMDFFLKKNIQDDLSVKLFNNFVSALLDKSVNLGIVCCADSSSVTEGSVMKTFESSWKASPQIQYRAVRRDTLNLKHSSRKVKIRTEVSEPLTGGQMWTFDNGIRVIFKKDAGSGMFHYDWILKGGYSLVPGLRTGEGVYMSDMLGLYSVAGMSCGEFADMLSANGISLTGKVSVSDFSISGAAPVGSLQLLLRSLYSLAENRNIDKEAYAYYRKCQEVRMMYSVTLASCLDSLMFPGNPASPYRRNMHLSEDFQKRADKYFSGEFARMNDGVLIIWGDFDEYELRKMLSLELGGFRTDKSSVMRSKIQYRSGSGNVMRIMKGAGTDAVVGFSAPLLFTSSNYMASMMASMKLQDLISGVLARYGWYGNASRDFLMFPEERFNFTMSCSMSSRAGMPASLMPSDSVELVLSAVRKAVSSVRMSASELSVYKSIMKKIMASSMSDAGQMMPLLELRYSCGKDIVTKYEDVINSVTQANVNNILSLLAGGRTGMLAIRPEHCGEQVKEAVIAEVQIDSIPEIRPWADSAGIAADAFRLIGIDTTASPLVWDNPEAFRRLVKELPKPHKLLSLPNRNQIKVVDSLSVQKDSVRNMADSLLVKVLPEDMKSAADSSVVEAERREYLN